MSATLIAYLATIWYVRGVDPDDVVSNLGGFVLIDLLVIYVVGAYLGVFPSI